MTQIATNRRAVLHVLPSFGVGGVPVRVAQIANGFGEKYRHYIVALDGDYACCERLDGAVDYKCIPFRPVLRSMLGRLWHFGRWLSRLNPDVLVTYNWGALELALTNCLSARRHLHVEDGFGPDEIDRQLLRRVWFRRLVLARCDRLLIPSRMLEKIATDVWRISEERLQYLPNGIDVDKFRQAPDRALLQRLRIPGGLIVGTVAALRTEKNLARLVKAFVQVRTTVPATLVIVGDGPERVALESLVRSLELTDSVVFTGHVSQPEVVLRAFDVFALSSDTEQMPYTILEAMAAGLPIASVDVGDVRYMVSHDNRPFIVSRSESTLASSVTALLTNRTLRRTLGEANQHRVQLHYGQDQMLDAYDELFSA
jgi:glycosyltransferase involved in cell wall biosynthesis